MRITNSAEKSMALFIYKVQSGWSLNGELCLLTKGEVLGLSPDQTAVKKNMPILLYRETRSAQGRRRKKESESYRTIWTNVYGKIECVS